MFVHLLWLTAIWLILTGDISVANVVLGLLMATGVLVLLSKALLRQRAGSPAQGGLYQALDLLAFFFWEVVISGVNVAVEVLRPQMRLRPAVVALPVQGMSPVGVMLLANLITMTPGTLSLHADEEAQVLYVHTMRVDDVDAFRRSSQQTFVRRVQEVVG